MELFDKLSDTIVSVSKDATQKAKDISEFARIRMEIRSKQDYINKLYLEIGKLYYEGHKEDEVKEFEDQMILIRDSEEVLDELKQQIGKLKGTVRCTQCGQDMPSEADYCSKCGTKLVKPQDEEEIIFEESADEAGEETAEEIIDIVEETIATEEKEAKEKKEEIEVEIKIKPEAAAAEESNVAKAEASEELG